MSTNKIKRFSMATATTGSLAEVLHDADAGLNVELVALNRISPDPLNPRGLGLDPADPRALDSEAPGYAEKAAQLEKLEELAQSIREIGVQTPIKVYRHGEGFRIAYGERRYLASVLAGKAAIPAVILNERPAQLRLIQLVENLQREDLSPWHRVENVRMVVDELREEGRAVSGGEALADIIGLGRTQAFQYWAVLNGPEDVRAALKGGLIQSIDKAALLARIEDDEDRDEALQRLLRGEEPVPAKPLPKAPPKPSAPKRAGRKATRVTLGATARTDVVRRIVEAVAGADRFGDVDWSDFRAATAAFRKLLADLEKGKL